MSKENNRREALVYHAKPQPGKIEVVPTKKYSTQRDLALAYSPGVALPCLEIDKDINNVYKYTNKGNLVAVISNGTAVLGLGDIGPEASKPVMEGKGLLFKIFAGIDVFDIELEANTVEEFVAAVKAIAPTFGGINLEDIKAPEAFEIERRLKAELNIPVMHDDQHGTAIISCAALLNALELSNKKMEDVRIVISGAGAAAVSCTRLYKTFGAKPENIVMTDSKGVIRLDRENLTAEKKEFATAQDYHTLEEAMVDADVFIGLSKANIVSPAMLNSMASHPIVFAMANPDPEIAYALACQTRDDILMATGRSDHPNQVNNVLGFPFIFRGALDVRASSINEAMKKAAVKALAELAKKPVPEQVNLAYNETRLTFGQDYIIPKPFDPRLIVEVPMAVAKAAMESGVANEPIEDWERYREQLAERTGSEQKTLRVIHHRAKQNPKRVVFAEADQLDVLKAAQIVKEEGIAEPILLGRKAVIKDLMASIDFDEPIEILDPKSEEEREIKNHYAQLYWEEQSRKGVTEYEAKSVLRERNYFASMMVKTGDADAMLSGYSRNYASVVKPIMNIIGKAKGVSRIAATNLMLTDRGPLFLSDTSINLDPTAKELAKIAQMNAKVAELFGFKPVTAMLSYANFGAANHPSSKKVSEAVAYLERYYPDLEVDGPLQSDFALNKEMLAEKFPFSNLVKKNVNTLIFPNLESANITYKLLKELNGALSVGPILLGLSKPVHVLQLGASVDEIVNMTAVAVIDAQEKERE
ncbi:MAG: NADP-dependent malic enzyme [Flavobacteriaceae bacterium]